MIEVCYHTTRGASMARCFYDVTSAHSFIVTLRKSAKIFVQGNGERKQIGAVVKSDGRWNWYYDNEAAEQSAHLTDGILRDLQIFSTPQPFLNLNHFATQPIGR